MAETQQKRPREELGIPDSDSQHENPKRQKSFNQSLSILDEEQDESNHDLSDIFQTLRQELSSDSATDDPFLFNLAFDHQSGGSPTTEKDEGDEENNINMMRRLLEASDDELGIPNRADEESNRGEEFLSLGDGIWEFEDYAANYYEFLQSELFI